MLQILEDIIKMLPNTGFLYNPKVWNSLNITYYPPHIERLWIQLGDYRISLHFIHKTDEACLLHKHRWPSAIRLLYGSYEMGVTSLDKDVTAEEALKLPITAKTILTAGSSYEMIEPNGLYYVKPITPFSLSLMVSGPPYPDAKKELGQEADLKPLGDDRKEHILELFAQHWPGIKK